MKQNELSNVVEESIHLETLIGIPLDPLECGLNMKISLDWLWPGPLEMKLLEELESLLNQVIIFY